MNNLFIFSFVIVILTIFSIYAHEYGHILMAKKLGHSFHGFVYHWSGIGARIDISKKPRDIWKIALAGLLVTAGISMLSFPFINFWFINYLFVLNFFIFLINAIPLGPTDGRQVIKGLREPN